MSFQTDIYDAANSGKDPNRVVADVLQVCRDAGVGPPGVPAAEDQTPAEPEPVAESPPEG